MPRISTVEPVRLFTLGGQTRPMDLYLASHLYALGKILRGLLGWRSVALLAESVAVVYHQFVSCDPETDISLTAFWSYSHFHQANLHAPEVLHSWGHWVARVLLPNFSLARHIFNSNMILHSASSSSCPSVSIIFFTFSCVFSKSRW